jgi:hypothetical protein
MYTRRGRVGMEDVTKGLRLVNRFLGIRGSHDPLMMRSGLLSVKTAVLRLTVTSGGGRKHSTDPSPSR